MTQPAEHWVSCRAEQWPSRAEQERPNHGESDDGVFFFYGSRNRGMATGILPLCFKSKFPWPYRGSYFVKKKNTVIRFAVVWSFSWCVCHCLFLIGIIVMVDSPRFPQSSGIDPNNALLPLNFSERQEFCERRVGWRTRAHV